MKTFGIRVTIRIFAFVTSYVKNIFCWWVFLVINCGLEKCINEFLFDKANELIKYVLDAYIS